MTKDIALYKYRKAKKLCTRCGKRKPSKGRTRCGWCTGKMKAYQRLWKARSASDGQSGAVAG